MNRKNSRHHVSRSQQRARRRVIRGTIALVVFVAALASIIFWAVKLSETAALLLMGFVAIASLGLALFEFTKWKKRL